MNIREIIGQNLSGATFITIDTETPVTLKGGKANPLQGRVTKVATGNNVMAFANKNVNGYDAMVRRRLEQEGKDPDTFTLSPRAWGVREEGIPFVTHKGKDYLEVIFMSCGKIEYRIDGQVANPEDIQGLETDKAEGHQGGLSNKVIIRTYSTENIQKIRINRQEFVRSDAEFIQTAA